MAITITGELRLVRRAAFLQPDRLRHSHYSQKLVFQEIADGDNDHG